METVEQLASKVLGTRTGEYKHYAPEVLAPVPRNLSLEHIGVKMEELEGDGFDLWYSYEFNCLTYQGLPISAVLKFIIPHESKNIIESKSFKLYCNSFAGEKMGETKEDALNKVITIMEKDLSKAAEGRVQVSIVDKNSRVAVFNNYVDLMTLVDPKMEVTEYNENPNLLSIDWTDDIEHEYFLKFDALRSACRITHQPDTGSAYIHYKSTKHINEESLVRYLSSLRFEYHFHEEILITIFKRLSDLLNSEDVLECCALYQRRGSLDIGPWHAKNLNTLTDGYHLSKDKIFAYDPNSIMR